MMIGIDPVAFLAASTAGVPLVTIRSTFRRTSSVVEEEMKPFLPHRLELKDSPRLVEWLKGLMPPS